MKPFNYFPVVFKEYNTIFKPLPFTIESFEYSAGLSVDNLTLIIANQDLSQTSIQLNKDQRGQQVVIGYAVLDKQGNVLGVFELFSGRISSVEIDNKNARFTIKQDLMWWNNSTLRLHTFDLFPNQKDLTINKVLKWGSK